MNYLLNFAGQFWLPGKPEIHIPGTFTFNQSGGGNLSLLGSFRELQELFTNVDPHDYRRIIGDDRGDIYTLDNCLRTNQSFKNGELRQDFRIGRVIKDVEYEENEEIVVDQLVIEIDHLLEWSRISGIELQVTYTESSPSSAISTLVCKNQPTQSINVLHGHLKLKHSTRSFNHGVREHCFSQEVTACFDFDTQRTLSEALQSASDLQDLIAIATYSRPSFRKVFIHHSDLYYETGDEQRIPRPAQLFEEWIVLADDGDDSIRKIEHSFDLEDLGGIDGVGRWMRAAEKYREPLGRVMSTRYHRKMTVQDSLLGRIAALERFYQMRYQPKKKVNLVEQLQELAQAAGEDFKKLVGESTSDNASTWRILAKDLRNEVAHQFGRMFQRKTIEVHYVSQAAYWLFVFCFLGEAEAPRGVLDKLIDSPQFRLDSKGLQDVLHNNELINGQ
jgi:hypothetical protein